MASVEVSTTPVQIEAPEGLVVTGSVDQLKEDSTESSPPTVDRAADVSEDSKPTDAESPPPSAEKFTPADADEDQNPKGPREEEIPVKGTHDLAVEEQITNVEGTPDHAAVNEEVTRDSEVAVTEVKEASTDAKSLVAEPEPESESATAEDVTPAAAIDPVAPTADDEIPAPIGEDTKDAEKELSVEKAEDAAANNAVAATDAAPEEKISSAKDAPSGVAEDTSAAEVNPVSE